MIKQKCNMCLYLLFVFGPQTVAGQVLLNRIYSSFPPLVHPFHIFLEFVSLVFSKSWHDARNRYEFDFPEKKILNQKRAKNRVFLFFEKFSLIFYCICSVMKTCFI